LLALPGGLPLIGDVSPLQPLPWLAGLIRGNDPDQGWTGQLVPEEREALTALREQCFQPDVESLRADGWLRFDIDGWSGLWHAVPGGWPHEDRHGHQDVGSFVLHAGTVPLFVDIGGTGPGEADGAEFRALASVHNGVQLDGCEPYPTDHPDYTGAFRSEIGGLPPELKSEYDGVSLFYDGFARLRGPRGAFRRWHFAGGGLTIEDHLRGTGRYLLTRRLVTPLTVTVEDDGAILEGGGKRFRVRGDAPLVVGEARRWLGGGVSEPATVLEFSARVGLPWHGRIVVEPA
jgi:hypothetical protein